MKISLRCKALCFRNSLIGLLVALSSSISYADDLLWKTYQAQAGRSFASGRPKQALSLYKAAFDEIKTVPHNDSRYIATLGGLAKMYKETGRSDKKYKNNLETSEKLYKELLGIVEEAKLAPESIAKVMDETADLYQAQKRTKEAEALLKQALELRERSFPANSPELLNSLKAMAKFYEDAGDEPKATALKEQSQRSSIVLGIAQANSMPVKTSGGIAWGETISASVKAMANLASQAAAKQAAAAAATSSSSSSSIYDTSYSSYGSTYGSTTTSTSSTSPTTSFYSKAATSLNLLDTMLPGSTGTSLTATSTSPGSYYSGGTTTSTSSSSPTSYYSSGTTSGSDSTSSYYSSSTTPSTTDSSLSSLYYSSSSSTAGTGNTSSASSYYSSPGTASSSSTSSTSPSSYYGSSTSNTDSFGSSPATSTGTTESSPSSYYTDSTSSSTTSTNTTGNNGTSNPSSYYSATPASSSPSSPTSSSSATSYYGTVSTIATPANTTGSSSLTSDLSLGNLYGALPSSGDAALASLYSTTAASVAAENPQATLAPVTEERKLFAWKTCSKPLGKLLKSSLQAGNSAKTINNTVKVIRLLQSGL